MGPNVNESDAVDEQNEPDSDMLDDLAAFLMHHTYDASVSEPERLQIFTIVEAHQRGDDPIAVGVIMRKLAMRFRDEPGFRREWRPGLDPPT